MVTAMDNATRFIQAMTQIEKELRDRDERLQRSDYHLEFKTLVDRSKHLAFGQKKNLKKFVDLRNTIVHEPRDSANYAIADPRDSVVQWVEDQLVLLTKPPLVITELKLQPPKVLNETDNLLEFLTLVRDYNFSQAPVRENDGDLRLVTTNAVSRWVASEYRADEGVLLDSIQLQEIKPFAEEQDALICKPRNLKVVEAVRIFAGEEKGNIPAAIILTESGNPREKPLGICVVADVARLLSILKI